MFVPQAHPEDMSAGASDVATPAVSLDMGWKLDDEVCMHHYCENVAYLVQPQPAATSYTYMPGSSPCTS